MNCYNWSNNLKIIVYGVNSYAQNLVGQLQEMGFEVCAYIDRRAQELKKINKIPVYSLKEAFCDVNDESVCVIIMLMNAMQHDQIAYELFRKGIKKIIFVPMTLECNDQPADQLRRVYNMILTGDFDSIGQIPYYEGLIQNFRDALRGTVCEETQNYLTVRVSADIVYTNSKEKIKNEKDNLLYYADVPLIAYKAYNDMFDYFWGGQEEGELSEYVNDYGVNRCMYSHSHTNESIILQREELYELWNEHFQEGLEFFISSAPLAKWNDRGFFNLWEGHHRSLFLLKKGIYYLPLRISRSDWEKWKNSKIVHSIGREKYFVTAISPIHNPYFQKRSFYNNISIIESMLSLQQNMPRELYYEKTVLNLDTLLGYYGFNLRRMGAESVVIYAEDDCKKNVVEQILRLYELKQINICDSVNWEDIDQFSFISVIGISKELRVAKREILKAFGLLKIKTVLISLTKAEMEIIDESVRPYLSGVSKVFLETEMVNIYLLRKDS